jgi:hypothetical protein
MAFLQSPQIGEAGRGGKKRNSGENPGFGWTGVAGRARSRRISFGEAAV